MGNEVFYEDLIAFHPGSYVEEIVEDLNITQNEFAERLGTTSKTVSKLINGEENISNDIANKLAKLTGISLKTWMNLQNAYDIKVIEIEEAMKTDEKDICQMIDFSFLKKMGLVENRRYLIDEKIKELRKLLNMSNLSLLNNFNSAVSYRNNQKFNQKSIVNSNVMLELASNNARNKTDIKYKKEKLDKILPEIRKMTLQDPDVFYPKLKERLLECGIVLVGLPNLKNAGLQGATKRFKNGSVLLLITDRNKASDIFWFSLIHEIGHIYNNDFYSDYEDEELYKKNEFEADRFAQNFLIPDGLYNEFIKKSNFTRVAITEFSKEVEIHPSIVVGRLQNDKYIEFNHYNDLKAKYSFSFIA